MTLIGIIIAIICEYTLSHLQKWREHHWFLNYARWLKQTFASDHLWNSVWGLFPLFIPLLLGVGFLQQVFGGEPTGLLSLIYGVVILILCLGPRDLREEVEAYDHAISEGDRDRIIRIKSDIYAGPGRMLEKDHTSLEKHEGRSLARALLLQGHERLFAVLFWFFLLGPIGAVLYRVVATLPKTLISIEAGEGLQREANNLHGILSWPTARLTAFLFALSGSTDDAFHEWRTKKYDDNPPVEITNWRLMSNVGGGALRFEDTDHKPTQPDLHAALAMVHRTLLMLLALLALFTIGGWLS